MRDTPLTTQALAECVKDDEDDTMTVHPLFDCARQMERDRSALIELIQSFLRYEITRDQLRTQAKRIAHRKDPENNA